MGWFFVWGCFNDIICEVLGLCMFVKYLKWIFFRRVDVIEVVVFWIVGIGFFRIL